MLVYRDGCPGQVVAARAGHLGTIGVLAEREPKGERGGGVVNEPIIWTNEKRKLRDLVPWEHNPREIHEKEAKRLGESLELFGQIQTLAIGPDGELYDGHQRRYVWSVLPRFGPDYEVDVRVSSRPLTERERQQLVVYLHRGTIAEWDWDTLANAFEVGDLLEWGFKDWELGIQPTEDEWADAFDSLPDGDKAPFQQMTFTLHDTQAEQVKAALDVSKLLGAFVDSPNENSNGNALARICETYITDYGQS